METEINIEHFPVHILEEIFSYVPKNQILRLVSKSFKYIIDNSRKLMKDHLLCVKKALEDDSSTVNQHYQNLALSTMNTFEYYWIRHYQHKSSIKCVKIKDISGDIEDAAAFLQYILTNFDNLEVLEIHAICSIGRDFYRRERIEFVPNNLSKLETLCIFAFYSDGENILEMFANIPSIKNLYIFECDYNLVFPNKVEWKLEKLGIGHGLVSDRRIDDNNLKIFLQTQQKTLKVFIFSDTTSYANFVMRYLPNLETLAFSIKSYEEIDDKFLISNERLKRLALNVSAKDNIPVLKTLLNHFKNVEYLYLSLDFSDELKPLTTMTFENVTHLLLNGCTGPFLLNVKVPNLRVLELQNKAFRYDQFLNENMKNIEKLSILFWSIQDVYTVLQKCPKLSHLNLDRGEWSKRKSLASVINKILEVAPQIKCLGIGKYSLQTQGTSYEELLAQIVNKRVILKIYNGFESMIVEDWGRECAEDMGLY